MICRLPLTRLWLPLRSYYYIGSFPAAVFFPFWLLIDDPVAARVQGGLFFAAFILLASRLLEVRPALVLLASLVFPAFVLAFIVDQGPVGPLGAAPSGGPAGGAPLPSPPSRERSDLRHGLLGARACAAVAGGTIFLGLWVKLIFGWWLPAIGLFALAALAEARRRDESFRGLARRLSPVLLAGGLALFVPTALPSRQRGHRRATVRVRVDQGQDLGRAGAGGGRRGPPGSLHDRRVASGSSQRGSAFGPAGRDSGAPERASPAGGPRAGARAEARDRRLGAGRPRDLRPGLHKRIHPVAASLCFSRPVPRARPRRVPPGWRPGGDRRRRGARVRALDVPRFPVAGRHLPARLLARQRRAARLRADPRARPGDAAGPLLLGDLLHRPAVRRSGTDGRLRQGHPRRPEAAQRGLVSRSRAGATRVVDQRARLVPPSVSARRRDPGPPVSDLALRGVVGRGLRHARCRMPARRAPLPGREQRLEAIRWGAGWPISPWLPARCWSLSLLLEVALRLVGFAPERHLATRRIVDAGWTRLLDCYPSNPREYFEIDLDDPDTRERYFSIAPHRFDAIARWHPWAVESRYNELRFRDVPPEPKAPGVYRIAIAGDSFTEGAGGEGGADSCTGPRSAARRVGFPELQVLNCGRRGLDLPELMASFEGRSSTGRTWSSTLSRSTTRSARRSSRPDRATSMTGSSIESSCPTRKSNLVDACARAPSISLRIA